MAIANTNIQLKKSGVTGNVPPSLAYGELALNYADGRLYYKNASGVITYIQSGTSTNSFSTINSNSSLILATSPLDTLSIVAGNNISISTDTLNKIITINSTATGGGGGGTTNAISFIISDDVFTGTGSTTAFTLSATPPDVYSVIVNINGVLQLTSSYSVAGNILTFTEAPASGATIEVKTTQGVTSGTVNGAIDLAQAAFNKANVASDVNAWQNTQIVTINNYYADAYTKANNAYSLAQGADGLAAGAFNKANTNASDISIIQGVNLTQNNNITYVNQFAQSAYNAANAAGSSAYVQAAFDKANTASANTIIIQGVDNTQNTNITTANNAAWAAFAAGNTNATNITLVNQFAQGAYNTANGANGLASGAFNKANNALANTSGTFAGDLTVTGNVTVGNIYGTLANTSIVAGSYTTTFDNAGKLTLPGMIVFADTTTQNTAFVGNAADQTARNLANGANGMAVGAYAAANTNATNITYVNQFTQSAYNKANSALPLTGGTVTGTLLVGQDVYVSGNLFVNGNTTTVSTNNVTLNDSLIYLADQNPANTVDIGLVGHFVEGHYQHTGVVRNHLNGNWVFFSNVSTEPSTTINFAEANLTYDSITTGGIITPSATINGKDWQTVENTQNTNITSVNQYAASGYALANTNASDISILQGVNTTQNTNITSVNQYAASGYSLANTNASLISIIQGVDNTQNTNITTANNAAWAAFAAGNTNATNITSVNQYAASGYALANTHSSQISIIQGVDLGQNTTITAVNQFAQAAFDKANTGSVTLSDSVSSNSSTTAATSNAVLIAVSTALAYSIALG